MDSSDLIIRKFEERKSRFAFLLFQIYIISFFLRLPARFPLLGIIRFDLFLVVLIILLIFNVKSRARPGLDHTSKYLIAILFYSLITLPLVEWPGSVISAGIFEFIKGAIFYFFTVNLVVNSARLKSILAIFIACNLIRILEPLFLNITTGYLGSETHLGGGNFAGRLSGGPADVINPNGLAFVIATVIPFLHYVFASTNRASYVVYVMLIPILVYTMGLTLSRSGVLALALIALGIWIKSSHKFFLMMLGIAGLVVIFSTLNDIQKDRYLSLVSDDAVQSASAKGRIEGWAEDFRVALNRPVFGHGLGTSREANWNVSGKDQISHILWMEVWQEIGLIGLILFILYIVSMIKNFHAASKLIRTHLSTDAFLYRSCQAMQVWLLMNLLFSLASYGLKSYEWYFFGGLSVVLLRAVQARIDETELKTKDNNLGAKPSLRFGLAHRINRF